MKLVESGHTDQRQLNTGWKREQRERDRAEARNLAIGPFIICFHIATGGYVMPGNWGDDAIIVNEEEARKRYKNYMDKTGISSLDFKTSV